MKLPEIKSISKQADGSVVVRHAGKPGEFVFQSEQHLRRAVIEKFADIETRMLLAIALRADGARTVAEMQPAVTVETDLKV